MATEVANEAKGPRTRLAAFALLWIALIAQVVWILIEHFQGHVALGAMWYPLTVVVGCLLLAITNGRVRWVATLLRLIIAVAFLEAVSDRFGLLGGPGTPGVAWGDFAHFIAYTGKVNSFLPRAIIPAVAVLATICEIIFGITMLLGISIRKGALGSAILLFLFATAMTISRLSQFSYGVYLMCAGALALSTTGAPLLSVDALIRHQREESRW